MSENYDKKKILRREKRISIIPSLILPLVLWFAFSCYFALMETENAFGLSLFTSILYPAIVISIYVKQAKLTDFSSIKSGKYFFETKGYEKTVIRFDFLETLFYKYFIILVIILIPLSIILTLSVLNLEHNEENKKIQLYIATWILIPFIMVYTMMFFKYRFRSYNDFHYHYSLGCFKIANSLKKSEEIESINYILKGLQNYNHFINKNFNLRLNVIGNLMTLISLKSFFIKKQILDDIIFHMTTEKELVLLPYFTKLLGKTNQNSLLEPYTIFDKLKDRVPIIIILSSTLGVSIQLILKFY